MKTSMKTAAVLSVLAVSGLGMGRRANPGVIPVNSHAWGTSYRELAARWWQWALIPPLERNPILDETGEDQSFGQSGHVWFLAGNFGGTSVRNVTIPRGKAIFFPIINSEWDTVPGFQNPLNLPDPLSVDDIRAITSFFIDGNTSSCEIDGRPVSDIQQYRVRSDLFSFDFGPGAADAFGYPVEHVETAVADGVWIMLAPPSRGSHTIRFTASSPHGFSLDVTYNITVE